MQTITMEFLLFNQFALKQWQCQGFQLTKMDCSQYTGESVVSLLEYLVRSPHAKKSRGRDGRSWRSL